MTVQLSRYQVQCASENAIILVEGEQAFIVEREADGGIIHPAATDTHQCYPICMAFEPGDRLEAGDWVVIPYVKNSPGGESLYGRDGTYHNIVWAD